MITVAPISRADIDAWTLEESGLSIRIVNSCTREGWRTVGDLRSRPTSALLALRSLGRISAREIQRFFATCDAISRGQKQFATLAEMLELFLDQDEREVLTARYGLLRTDLAASRNYFTLQRIGNDTTRTRERVRQVEESALRHLRSRLAQTCLTPVARIYEAWLKAFGGVLACSELAEYPDPDFLAPYNPCSVLLLLHDTLPGCCGFHRQFFTLIPEATLLRVEQAALEHLARQPSPARAGQLLDSSVRAALGDAESTDLQRLVELVLAQHPAVLTTRDGRHAVAGSALAALLREAMAGLPAPAHFREITKALNTMLVPEKRRGSGFTLKHLAAQPDLSRPTRGYYAIAHAGAGREAGA